MADPRFASWTPAEVEPLGRLWCVDGLTADAIAKRMPGRTRNAIISRLHRMGMGRESQAKAARTPSVMPSAPCHRGVIRFGHISIPKSVIPIKPPPERIATESVTLLDRRSEQCGWPVNDGAPFLYCGALLGSHRRYCDRRARTGMRGGAI